MSKRRVAMITGGGRGIGKGMAMALSGAGYDVAVVSRSNDFRARLETEFTEQHLPKPLCLEADVTDYPAMQMAVKRVQEYFGGLDVVCANAGIFPSASLEELTPEILDDIFAINVNGTIFAVQAALPVLKKSSAGRIIITSSITGPITGFPGWSHYGATKAAQLGFMRSAALELAPYGISVNAVLPGNIMTEGLAAMGSDYVAKMTKAIPMKRLGEVADIGALVVFLASEQAGYITGQGIVVDGGQILPESMEAVL